MTTFDKPVIVGAGLAGLIAAHAWPSFEIAEAAPAPREMHRALLRFRSDAVARLTGIEFKKVRVNKGIWYNDGFRAPDIQLANFYAQKVVGRLASRSIWDISAVDRYIAPEHFYEQLLESTSGRITFGCEFDYLAQSLHRPCRPIISTAPLPVVIRSLELATLAKFDRSPITVFRFKIPNADVYQTIYFPDLDTPMYRASITGDTAIIECVNTVTKDGMAAEDLLVTFARAFGLGKLDFSEMTTVNQSYGKIAPIDDALRKQWLFKLTHDHNIFSLGRFATWRNILLDDVVDDIAVIKKLMRSSHYDLRHTSA